MDTDPLFDLPAAPPAAKLSAGRRLTVRRNAALAGSRHPITRLPLLAGDHTCGDCGYARKHDRWWKCHAATVTNGPATDLRVGWPACELFTARDTWTTCPGCEGFRTVPITSDEIAEMPACYWSKPRGTRPARYQGPTRKRCPACNGVGQLPPAP